MESRLDTRRFARIHRSRIVNTERIKELQPWFNGDYVVILRDGTRADAEPRLPRDGCRRDWGRDSDKWKKWKSGKVEEVKWRSVEVESKWKSKWKREWISGGVRRVVRCNCDGRRLPTSDACPTSYACQRATPANELRPPHFSTSPLLKFQTSTSSTFPLLPLLPLSSRPVPSSPAPSPCRCRGCASTSRTRRGGSVRVRSAGRRAAPRCRRRTGIPTAVRASAGSRACSG